jgi:hypothetical protein
MLGLLLNLWRASRKASPSRTEYAANASLPWDDPLTLLKQRLTYEAIPVTGGNNVVWFLLCALLTVVMIAHAWETRELLGIIGALGFLWLSTVLFLTLVPRLGKPTLTLTRSGLDLPTYGLIPWEAVHNLTMDPLRSAYGSVGYMLNLEVPSLPDRIDGMHPATRLMYRLTALGRRRTLISIRLAKSSLPAQQVLALIEHLRQER